MDGTDQRGRGQDGGGKQPVGFIRSQVGQGRPPRHDGRKGECDKPRDDSIDSQKKSREAEGRIEWTGQCLRDTAFLSDHHGPMVLRRRYPSCPLPYTCAPSPTSNSIVVSSRPMPAVL